MLAHFGCFARSGRRTCCAARSSPTDHTVPRLDVSHEVDPGLVYVPEGGFRQRPDLELNRIDGGKEELLALRPPVAVAGTDPVRQVLRVVLPEDVRGDRSHHRMGDPVRQDVAAVAETIERADRVEPVLHERPAKTLGRTVFSETSEVLGRQEEQALAQNRPPVDATVAVISRRVGRRRTAGGGFHRDSLNSGRGIRRLGLLSHRRHHRRSNDGESEGRRDET